MTSTKTRSELVCWNCKGEAEGEHELVVEISRKGEGRQQRTLPLCNHCAESFGTEG